MTLAEAGIGVRDLDAGARRRMLTEFIAAHPDLEHENIGEPDPRKCGRTIDQLLAALHPIL